MKELLKLLAVVFWVLGITLQVHAQGYIVPNGVVYSGLSVFGGYEIDVSHDPTNATYTGFFLEPAGKTPPGSIYTNTFLFTSYVDVGVRVFFVEANQPISLEPIMANSYTELKYPNTYVFDDGFEFSLGFYTGPRWSQYPPTDPITYADPLFGWASFVNNHGVIEMIDSAIEYKGGGIFAGTQTIIVPEPGTICLFGFGALFFGRRFLCKRP